MTKMQWKIYKAQLGFGTVTTIQYDISIANTKKLYDGLNAVDKEKFMFDADQVSLTQKLYAMNLIEVCENLDRLEQAHSKRIKWSQEAFVWRETRVNPESSIEVSEV
jgi:hypothetical protein